MDEKVLSYGDVVLRTSDLEILRRNNAFINDRIIEFYFTYLLDPTEQHEEEEQKQSNKNMILLLPPVVAFWISHFPGTSETLRDSVDPLLLPQRELVMFVVNDNEDVDSAGGGQHWSLLVYYRSLNKFEHYDTMGGMNAKEAKKLASTIKMFLGSNGTSTQFEEVWTPQQDNGYDCGLYVMGIAEVLLKAYTCGLVGSIKCKDLLQEKIAPRAMSKMRGIVLNTILTLAKAQKRA